MWKSVVVLSRRLNGRVEYVTSSTHYSLPHNEFSHKDISLNMVCGVCISIDLTCHVNVLTAMDCSATLTKFCLGISALQVRMALNPSLNSGIFQA